MAHISVVVVCVKYKREGGKKKGDQVEAEFFFLRWGVFEVSRFD